MNILEASKDWMGFNQYDGSHKIIIDKYNQLQPLPRGYKMKYTDFWCMAFVSACASVAGSPVDFPYECSCAKAILKLKQNGRWIENDAHIPEPMDLVFYDWQDSGNGDNTGTPDHVGIVVSIDKDEMVIREGNYNGFVKQRYLPINSRYIRGFGNTHNLWSKNPTLSIYEIAIQVRAGKWGNGQARREALESAGYDYDKVQAEVNRQMNWTTIGDNDLMAVALEVFRGKWGNGKERRIALTEAGYDYEAVQEIVNNFYKKE